jgi:hypothetical protein
MNISLDYDDTYTRDKYLWRSFIVLAKASGHNVYCVTMRSPAEGNDVRNDLSALVNQIIFTSRKAKKEACYKLGIHIDVWIDDMPLFVIKDAPPDADYDATIGD